MRFLSSFSAFPKKLEPRSLFVSVDNKSPYDRFYKSFLVSLTVRAVKAAESASGAWTCEKARNRLLG